jgi:hypothetical protein
MAWTQMIWRGLLVVAALPPVAAMLGFRLLLRPWR